MTNPHSTPVQTQTIILGGGCFWCLDAIYRRVEGVTGVLAGYAGGHTKNPDYWSVAGKTTGHAEVVQVTFDPKTVNLADILDIFWTLHDPTTKDRQGYDVGPEYRSIILYQGDDQLQVITNSLKAAQELWSDPIVTEVKPLETFYEAEPEQQDFYNSGRRPDYCQIVINPKLTKLRAKFAGHLKPAA